MDKRTKTRTQIDKMLKSSGWEIQSAAEFDLRETSGTMDYLLFLDRHAIGGIKATTAVQGDQDNSDLIARVTDLPKSIPHTANPLPFLYKNDGRITVFMDLRDPKPDFRIVFTFHRPECLREWIAQKKSLRARVSNWRKNETDQLHPCQVDLYKRLIKSIVNGQSKSLVQMTSGSGKTHTAQHFLLQMLKYHGVNRILYLVDRDILARRIHKRFLDLMEKDEKQRYKPQVLDTRLDPESRICITTMQRLYGQLCGQKEIKDENSLFFHPPRARVPKKLSSRVALPMEYFDFIVIDDCHWSIFKLWEQVLEYFDAIVIALATVPCKRILNHFHNRLLFTYSHERAVVDGLAVGYKIFLMEKEENGANVIRHFRDNILDKPRQMQWRAIEERSTSHRTTLTAEGIKDVIQCYRDNLFSLLFPTRKMVPKTLIFAQNEPQAELICKAIDETFDMGENFCALASLKLDSDRLPKLIRDFEKSNRPRILVTTDLLATGVSLKTLESIITLRYTGSTAAFEQLKGRGSHTVSPAQLKAVTPDAVDKSHFVILDAIGLSAEIPNSSFSLIRSESGVADLMNALISGNNDDDILCSLVDKLISLEKRLKPHQNKKIQKITAGKPLRQILHSLIDVVDPDVKVEIAKHLYAVDKPDKPQIEGAKKELIQVAAAPFAAEELQKILLSFSTGTTKVDRRRSIPPKKSTKKSKTRVRDTFLRFLQENRKSVRDLISGKEMSLTRERVEELLARLKGDPYKLSLNTVWTAFAKDRPSGASPSPPRQKSDIIPLIKFATGDAKELRSFASIVAQNFEEWLNEQSKTGRTFYPEQREFLHLIRDQMVLSLRLSLDDFDYPPFKQKGGSMKMYQLFGHDINKIISELNRRLLK